MASEAFATFKRSEHPFVYLLADGIAERLHEGERREPVLFLEPFRPPSWSRERDAVEPSAVTVQAMFLVRGSF